MTPSSYDAPDGRGSLRSIDRATAMVIRIRFTATRTTIRMTMFWFMSLILW